MSEDSDKDQVFARPLSDVKAFAFNQAVTAVFKDMISRSVPGYGLLLHMIGLYATVFAQDKSNIYDLGCSIGDVTQILADQSSGLDCKVIAVDNSPSMIAKCRELGAPYAQIDWRCEDIQDIAISNASMVVLNLTLQFIEQGERRALVERIYAGLKPGGVLILSEKVLLENELENERMVQLYQAFKKTQGYSDLEISQKRSALENVLVSDIESRHRERLTQAGFSEVYQCFRCFNFVSYLAIK